MYVLALSEGVQFPTIHRILEYRQRPWLKKYIDLNTNLRMQATNTFHVDYYKLMNNSVFGKWMEDKTKYVEFELFTEAKTKKFKKLHFQQPYRVRHVHTYNRCDAHDNDPYAPHCTEDDGCVVGMEKEKLSVTLDKPIYVGFKVLDIAKLIMYQAFYHVLQPHFGDRMSLCAHDTDSFILFIQSPDLDQELSQIRDHLDLSNYPHDHPLYDPTNRKIPGKLKDEYPARTLSKFVGLRSKCYSLKCLDDESVKRAKGTKKSVINKKLSFEDFEKCLLESEEVRREQTLLRSRLQTIYTVRQTKVALSSLDDKRILLPNHKTAAWGHFAY